MDVASYNSGGHIILEDGTEIEFSPTLSPFAPIASGTASYTVDSYDSDTITITHDDVSLSGTYDLNTGITLRDEALPYIEDIFEVLKQGVFVAQSNVKLDSRIIPGTQIAGSEANKLAYAMYKIGQIAAREVLGE